MTLVINDSFFQVFLAIKYFGLSLKQGTGNRGMGMGNGNGNGEWESAGNDRGIRGK